MLVTHCFHFAAVIKEEMGLHSATKSKTVWNGQLHVYFNFARFPKTKASFVLGFLHLWIVMNDITLAAIQNIVITHSECMWFRWWGISIEPEPVGWDYWSLCLCSQSVLLVTLICSHCEIWKKLHNTRISSLPQITSWMADDDLNVAL